MSWPCNFDADVWAFQHIKHKGGGVNRGPSSHTGYSVLITAWPPPPLGTGISMSRSSTSAVALCPGTTASRNLRGIGGCGSCIGQGVHLYLREWTYTTRYPTVCMTHVTTRQSPGAAHEYALGAPSSIWSLYKNTNSAILRWRATLMAG